MSDDRNRTYQTLTPLPSLRTQIAVPPLKMVLVNDMKNSDGKSVEDQAGASNSEGGLSTPATKERIVRKLIQHLKKDS